MLVAVQSNDRGDSFRLILGYQFLKDTHLKVRFSVISGHDQGRTRFSSGPETRSFPDAIIATAQQICLSFSTDFSHSCASPSNRESPD